MTASLSQFNYCLLHVPVVHKYTISLINLSSSCHIFQVLSTKTGNLLREVRKHKLTGLPVTCIRFHPKDPQSFMATCAEGQINMFNAADGVHSESITGNVFVLCVS